MTSSHDWAGAETLGAAGAGRPIAHDVAMRMLAFAQARIRAFAPFDLVINDVAWELLLALFVAQERGRRLSIAALCDTLDPPPTVSFRWLRALATAGLVDYDDNVEGQSSLVRLTPAADQALRGLIEG